MAREKVKFDLSTYKQEKAEKVAEIEAKKKGFNVFKTPADVEVLKLPKAKDGDDAITLTLDFLLYEQTREPHADTQVEAYGRHYFYHTNLGPDGNKTELCPRTFGGKCPICEKLKPFYEKGLDNLNKAEKEQFTRLKPKKSVLYNVIHDGEVKLFDIASSKFETELRKKLDLKAKKIEAVNGFACDEDGYTLNCTFAKESFGGHPFYKLADLDLDKRGPIPDEVFPLIVNLDDLFPKTKYEDLLKYVSDDLSGDTEEEEAEEEKAPVSNRRIGVTKKEPTWDTAEAPAEEDDKIPFDDYKKAKEEPEEAEEEEPRIPKARRRFTV